MPTFKVIDVRRIPTPDADRVGQMDTLVTYQLSPLQTYMVRIPNDKPDAAAIIEAVKKDLDDTQRFVGKEFEL